MHACRQNQELERAFQEDKAKLEREAHALAEQLQAVLSNKYVPQTDFDADTPIDKTLKILQTIIGVSIVPLLDGPTSAVFPCQFVCLSVCWSIVLPETEGAGSCLGRKRFCTAAFLCCRPVCCFFVPLHDIVVHVSSGQKRQLKCCSCLSFLGFWPKV